MRSLAKLLLVWTPSFVRARAASEMSADFNALVVDALHKKGPEAVEAFREAARESGRRTGERLKKQLHLGSSFEDAELAWRLVCKFAGMPFVLHRDDRMSVFDHKACPMLASGGAAMCESFCLPFVTGLTQSVCSSCSVAIVEPATDSRPCKKALVRPETPDAG